jgi:hypothetical protein
MVVGTGIEMPGIHFQDQNTEQYSNNNLTIIGYNQTMIEKCC